MLGFFLNAYLNQYKNEFFVKEIDRIKDQHVLTLEQLKQVDAKLNEILEFEQQKKVESVETPSINQLQTSYLSYLSFVAYPFVKVYRLFF